MRTKICFFSDSNLTINLYRADLADYCRAHGHDVVFASLKNFFSSIFKILRSEIVVSSNLRANIASLIFFQGKKRVVILNGLGRSREIKILRRILVFLFADNKRITLIVQNYRDYRWLRMLGIQCWFIRGSGGGAFNVTQTETSRWVWITRPSKILAQVDSFRDFCSAVDERHISMTVYGLTSFDYENPVPGVTLDFMGTVNPDKFFLTSSKFFQPEGYSEGFPHTLAHAIVSGCEIFMPKRLYIQYGLYKYNLHLRKIGAFVCFDSSTNPVLQFDVSLPAINNYYYRIISGFIKNS